ncbi:hypothetical protein BGZ50_001467 [Haplosporangium sp. Z 11]|nr:hypothetical protein BGZ50_001467 [Haplosporangium sp. Z 11]
MLNAFRRLGGELSKNRQNPKNKTAFKEVKAFVGALNSLLKWLNPRRFQMASNVIGRRAQTGKAALAMFLSRIGLLKVKAVFEVSFEDGQKLAQYIILLRDGGHICTWLQLGEADLEDEIKLLPLVSSVSHNSITTRGVLASDYLKDYLALLPSETPTAPSAEPLTSAMQRYVMTQGRFKKICQDAADNELWLMKVDEALEDLEDFFKGAFIEAPRVRRRSKEHEPIERMRWYSR